VFLNYFPDGSTSPASTPYPLLDGTGLHLPPAPANYRSPASSITAAKHHGRAPAAVERSDLGVHLDTGIFFTHNRRPSGADSRSQLNQLSVAATGLTYDNFFHRSGRDPVL